MFFLLKKWFFSWKVSRELKQTEFQLICLSRHSKIYFYPSIYTIFTIYTNLQHFRLSNQFHYAIHSLNHSLSLRSMVSINLFPWFSINFNRFQRVSIFIEIPPQREKLNLNVMRCDMFSPVKCDAIDLWINCWNWLRLHENRNRQCYWCWLTRQLNDRRLKDTDLELNPSKMFPLYPSYAMRGWTEKKATDKSNSHKSQVSSQFSRIICWRQRKISSNLRTESIDDISIEIIPLSTRSNPIVCTFLQEIPGSSARAVLFLHLQIVPLILSFIIYWHLLAVCVW